MRGTGAQADKGQPEDHCGSRAESKQQRPRNRLDGHEPQSRGATGAHQRCQYGDATLVAKAVQDKWNKQTGRRGRQLQQTMQGTRLRFAETMTD